MPTAETEKMEGLGSPKGFAETSEPAVKLGPSAISIGDLKPDAANCRKHNPRNIGAIVNSLHKVGAARSIVIDEDNTILAGNGLVEAAGEAGITNVRVVEADGNTVIAVRRTGLTAKQKAELAIADNRTAELAEWDAEQLLATIAEHEIDLAGIEFTADELSALEAETHEPGEVVEDEAPEASTVPTRCKPGDLWTLNDHRLLCGDSTKAEDVDRVMGGDKAALCFTSPPYGQQREYTKESKGFDWDELMRGVFGNLPMADDGQVLVNLGLIHREGEWLPYWDGWIEWMREQGWRRFGWYVWDQGWGLPGDWGGRFAPSHEFIFHFNKVIRKPLHCVEKKEENIGRRGGCTFRNSDGSLSDFTNPDACNNTHKIPDSVVRVNRAINTGKIESSHPAVFSVGLPSFVMEAYTVAGDVTYEPFCGSGTTIVAAEQLGRRCRGIEISPAYCDVILARWEKLTGKTAERVG